MSRICYKIFCKRFFEDSSNGLWDESKVLLEQKMLILKLQQEWRDQMSITCPFCSKNENEYYARNDYFFAVFDQFPVSKGHLLIIPYRHIPSITALSEEEGSSLIPFIRLCRAQLHKQFNPDGFNIGINEGHAGGQTIFHLHIHLIPRYQGDVPEPEGGVRGVIPDKRRYRHLLQ
jgi:diadenosine tetraphosphate (Ap4A) HIT family hydrolase